ncbi:MAG: putative small integral rane protein precursor [Akkermansiaceae bacterium]|nr:putative small integral rane protein precursor [Akkermansiaceae bacterium]
MKHRKNSWFSKFANKASTQAGHPATFAGAVLLILLWAACGPVFKYSDTWQLVINTSTTIITFLMVFLIQNSQNRDSAALQLKLDELIRVQKEAKNSLMDLENLEEKDIDKIRQEFLKLAKEHRLEMTQAEKDAMDS